MTCEKRGYLFMGEHSFIKKKNLGENLICVSWLSSHFWLRQHGPFYFSQVLVSGLYWATYSINQSVKLLSHSRPKIEFYLFAIAYLAPTHTFSPYSTFFLPFQNSFFFSVFFFFWLYHFLAEIPKLFFFLQENDRMINLI